MDRNEFSRLYNQTAAEFESMPEKDKEWRIARMFALGAIEREFIPTVREGEGGFGTHEQIPSLSFSGCFERPVPMWMAEGI